MTKGLVIFGTGELAEVAHHYFSEDSIYKVIGFTVEREFLGEPEFCGLPVVAFEDILEIFDPNSCSIFIALGYSKLNQVRSRIFLECKSKGFSIASYISTNAFVAEGVSFGENCFVLEDNTIQPFVTIGDNVVLWSGNHIGHHSTIGNHVFISSHVVVSGGVRIGDYCFVGVNATFRDHISVGQRTVIGAGALIMKNTPDDSVFIEPATPRSEIQSESLRL
jgi:sugar O-acyltransferase (sialic acid O-acetyltransferase NeuD family)